MTISPRLLSPASRRLAAAACALSLAAALPAFGAGPAKPAAQPAQSGDELAAAQAESAAHAADGVAAIVNDTVISTYDLRQRTALFAATSGAKISEDTLKELRSQVLKQLETERLQLLEAQKNNITVSAGEVDKAIEQILNDNHLKKEQLQILLSRAGVQMETLRGQIAAQIAWAKTVQDQYGDRVHVSKEEVDAEMARVDAGKDKPHFLVSEIFEAVDSPEQEPKVLKDMQDLENQMHQGASFATIARQFSQNPTAAKGGDLGLIQEGQIPPELYAVLAKMHTGDISEPIRSVGGFYILGLREREEGANAKISNDPPPNPNPEVLSLVRILLPIGPKPPQKLVEEAIQAANALREHIPSCQAAPEVAHQMKGVDVFNLGSMRLADLNAAMQTEIRNAQPGGVTQPFQSAAGIELIVRCDQARPQDSHYTPPTREEVENQLFEDKMSVFSRQYMRDLRRNADIEDKIKS
ncbi:MAG TPA: peptidylprolyl isomerase [Rhizomicrobium sp.]|nr:peptidylprolyl isomerase [Rhizomicrobium sp.]